MLVKLGSLAERAHLGRGRVERWGPRVRGERAARPPKGAHSRGGPEAPAQGLGTPPGLVICAIKVRGSKKGT
jgi:hypothetical protein